MTINAIELLEKYKIIHPKTDYDSNSTSVGYDYDIFFKKEIIQRLKNGNWQEASEILQQASIGEHFLLILDQAIVQYPAYKQQQHADEVLEKSLRVLATRDPIWLINMRSILETRPYTTKALNEAYDTPQAAQFIISKLNNLHESPDNKRFKSLSEPPLNSADNLYKLIANGRAELYTSTYNGILNRFLDKLNADRKNLLDIAENDKNLDKLPTFIEAAASYGRLDEVWARIPANKQSEVIDILINKAANPAEDFKYTVTLAETLTTLQHKKDITGKDITANDKKLLANFEDKLFDRYQRSSGEEHDRVGLIISHYTTNSKLTDIQEKNRTQFLGIQNSEKYKLPIISSIKAASLFQGDGKNYQSYTFYADKDGQDSFTSFINAYGGKRNGEGRVHGFGKGSDWMIEDKGEFIRIHSKDKNGKKIVIYANKPENELNSENDGVQKMNKEAAKEQGLKDGENPYYTIVVHRGHSYHVEDTIKSIGKDTSFVYLGSCGSYNEINNVLKQAPDAQILSTKSTGTMLVNDPLLKAINERLRNGEDLNWAKIWKDDLSKIKNSLKEDYIRPDQNAAVILTKKYNEIKAGDGQTSLHKISYTPDITFNYGGSHLPYNNSNQLLRN